MFNILFIYNLETLWSWPLRFKSVSQDYGSVDPDLRKNIFGSTTLVRIIEERLNKFQVRKSAGYKGGLKIDPRPADLRFLKIMYKKYRARICKRLRSPGIDSKESIPPAYVARRADTSNRVVVPARQAVNRFLGFLKGLQIRAQGLHSYSFS